MIFITVTNAMTGESFALNAARIEAVLACTETLGIEPKLEPKSMVVTDVILEGVQSFYYLAESPTEVLRKTGAEIRE